MKILFIIVDYNCDYLGDSLAKVDIFSKTCDDGNKILGCDVSKINCLTRFVL